MPSDRRPVDCEAQLGAIGASPRRTRARPGLWHSYRFLIEALVAAIAPGLDLATILAALPRFGRHLREPPRKREYQGVKLLSEREWV